jgi:hypothetical protein
MGLEQPTEMSGKVLLVEPVLDEADEDAA